MITDVNVNLSRWPFRRLPHDEPQLLVRKFRDEGITHAWAGSFDGLLHKDIAGVNQRLFEDCQKYGDGILIPVGSINPMLPNWEDDLFRCSEQHGMQIIRLHPNYHGYPLTEPIFEQLFARAAELKFIIQIVLKMEDERTHHPLMQVPTVDVSPLNQILKQQPAAKVVLLNSLRTLRGAALTELSQAGNVSFEISMQEGVGGIENLLKMVPLERVLFGSHFPFFYLESALLKLQESNLGEFRKAAIGNENAQRLLRAVPS